MKLDGWLLPRSTASLVLSGHLLARGSWLPVLLSLKAAFLFQASTARTYGHFGLEGTCSNPHLWSEVLRSFWYTGNLKRQVEKSNGKTQKQLSPLAITKRKREREKKKDGGRRGNKILFYFNTLVYNGTGTVSSFFCHVFRCEGTQ